MEERELSLATAPKGTWVQVDRKVMEKWGKLCLRSPRASQIMMIIVGNIGRGNALIASQQTLAAMSGCSLRTVQYALKTLREENWLQTAQVGSNGKVNAYIVNDRVAWMGKREGIRYSLFSANVLVSEAEQPNASVLDSNQPRLEEIPAMFQGERQLPSGDGLPPPSQPFFGGFEPDLPARTLKEQENT